MMRWLRPALIAALVLAVIHASALGAGSRLHPPVELLDADGEPVLDSARPVSTLETCGACHDAKYIASHSYHAAVGFDEGHAAGADGRAWSTSPGLFGRWDPMRYRRLTVPGEPAFDLGVADWIRLFGDRHAGGGPAYLARDGSPLAHRTAGTHPDPETHVRDPQTGAPVPWDWQASGAVEMNCFLCHLARPDDEARIAALQAGGFAWAATATLAKTGLVEPAEEGGWRYVRDRFDDDGLVTSEVLRLRDPRPENCGLCHGTVHMTDAPVRFATGPKHWETETKGQIWSPQRVSDSALNLENKGQKTYAWDVHAERLVACTDCHPSINNPVAFAEATRSKPRHLAYDARRLSIGEYLEAPSHHFAKGESAQGNVARRLDGSMRGCEDCHNALETHEAWLPNPRRHLRVLLCESCHTPRVDAPAHESCDWTVLTPEQGPRVTYRGIDGPLGDPASLIVGYEPVLLPRTTADGEVRHGPHNLCTAWWWVAGDPVRPVPLDRLQAAWYPDGASPHPDLVRVLDEDGDGDLELAELRLDTDAKVAAVRARLKAVGVQDPRIQGQVQPMSLHHNVVPGAFATRACETCHASASRITRPFEIAPYVPGGVIPDLVGDTNVRLAGRLAEGQGGRLVFEPEPTAAGRYLIGHDRAGWIDVLGLVLVLGTLVGVGGHAVARLLASRKAGKEVA